MQFAKLQPHFSSRRAITTTTTFGKQVTSRTFADATSVSGGKPLVLLPKDVDVSKLKFTPSKVTRTTGPRLIAVTYDNDDRLLRIQTPVVRIPFGITKFTETAQPNYSISITLDQLDTNPEMKKFADAMNSIDNKVLETAQKSKKEWFDKEIPDAVLEHNFKKSIRPPRSEGFFPLMKLKIPTEIDPSTKQVIPRTHVWIDRTNVSVDELLPQSKVINIIELRYVWSISSSMFGITWVLSQTKVVERPNKGQDRMGNYNFIETSGQPGNNFKSGQTFK